MDEAIKLAGLDWKVSTQPTYWVNEGVKVELPTRAIVRDTDKKVLGVVGPTYEPLQNDAAFRFFQPVVDAGEVTLETAGSLKGGRRVWILAKVKDGCVDIVKNDPVETYVLLAHAHDGTMSIHTGMTPTRVVCANTLAWAVSNKGSKLVRTRHTKNAEAALDEIRDVMDLTRAEFAATAEQFRSLARKGVNVDDLKKYVRKVFEPKLVEARLADATEQEDEICKRLTDKIIPLFESGAGTDIPGVRGTMWGAYNAVTEYLSHERGKTQDNRVDSLWFGDSAAKSRRALKLALTA